MSARFHHSGRKMPITTPRTVKRSQKIFFSIKPKTLPLIDTDNTDLKLKPKTLKHGGKEETEDSKIGEQWIQLFGIGAPEASHCGDR